MKRLLFIPILFFSTCTTTTRISSSNLSYLYMKNTSMLHPKYFVYHATDSISQVHFKIKTKELLYSKKDDERNFKAKVLIAYKLYSSYESIDIADSSSTLLTDFRNEQTNKELIGVFNIKANRFHQYLIEITTTDLNRNQTTKNYIDIDKKNPLTRQNFMVRLKDTGLPLFNNYVKIGEELIITYQQLIKDQLYVRYYKKEVPLSPPPFSIYNAMPLPYKADSLFSVELNDNNSTLIKVNKEGFYHFQSDTLSKSGLTLFCFDEHFPSVKSTDELILPLRYLTTKKEYLELIENENKKKALDKFWLNNAGNPDRAKELIKHFYNRVQDANDFFTSYTEGWRTDRGMIYIVYGPPNIIYKTSYSESWTYGEENNFMSLTYNFVKINNPFTDNDFSLTRAPMYKSNWYRMIDSWRQGRIYVSN